MKTLYECQYLNYGTNDRGFAVLENDFQSPEV
jgi:hypothetical protein